MIHIIQTQNDLFYNAGGKLIETILGEVLHSGDLPFLCAAG